VTLYCVDTSAWHHAAKPEVASRWVGALSADRVAICDQVRLEILYSSRSAADYDALAEELEGLTRIPIDGETSPAHTKSSVSLPIAAVSITAASKSPISSSLRRPNSPAPWCGTTTRTTTGSQRSPASAQIGSRPAELCRRAAHSLPYGSKCQMDWDTGENECGSHPRGAPIRGQAPSQTLPPLTGLKRVTSPSCRENFVYSD
jgi:hypothetical protein